MTILSILLQAQAPAGGGGAGMMNLIMIGLIILVFYFFMMRPQMKKAKEQRTFVEELDKGSKVVTIGGIVGKIVETSEKTFTIETRGGTRLEVLRSAISLENSRALNAESKAAESKSKKDKEEAVAEEKES